MKGVGGGGKYCRIYFNSPPSFITNVQISKKQSKDLGSWEESEVAGFFLFSHIRMMSYFRIGLKSAPHELDIKEKLLSKYIKKT